MAAFSRLQLAAALIEYDNDFENPNAINRSANDSAIFSHLRRRNLNPRTKSVHGLTIESNTEDLQTPSLNEGGADFQASRKSRASISTLQNPFRGELIEEEEPEEEEPEEPEVDLASWGLDAILPQRPKEKHRRKASHAKTIDVAAASSSKPSLDASRPQLRKTATTDEFGAFHGQLHEDLESQRHSISWDRRSVTSQNILDNAAPQTVPFPQTEDDTFRPPLPPMSRASRFDPKIQAHAHTVSVMSRGSGGMLELDDEPRARTLSGGTLATIGSQMPRLTVDGPDSFSRGRRASNASYGSHYLLQAGDRESIGNGLADDHEDAAFTRANLLRPKILVMPSPLQTHEPPPSSDPAVTPDGFQLAQNGFPFPAGAQTTTRPGIRPLSSMLTSNSLSGSSGNNPFTANPRQSLTLSQLTFRNSLMVGGQRDVAFDDLEQQLHRAQEEGEQIPIVNEEEIEVKLEEVKPAGKLFGKSLIDDLEARKAQMRSKQRTFMGDQRVSMMARSQPTLVDLNELQNRPGLLSPQRSSSRRRTLIDLDEDTSDPQGRMNKSASVFGVDTVWERELKKLKEIEEHEAAEVAEEKRRTEAVRAAELAKKEKKSKNKSQKKVVEPKVAPGSESHLPEAPPTLPAFELRPTVRRVPEPESEESDSDGEDDEPIDVPQQPRSKTWYAGDSDEEALAPKLSLPHISASESRPNDEDSDDDDIPLNQIPRERLSKSRAPDSDEDEDQPLVTVLQKMKGALSPIQSPHKEEDDDDEVPLAMRRLTTMTSFQSFNRQPRNQENDDDDRPLGLKVQQQQWAIQPQMMPQFNPGFPAMSLGPPSVMGLPAMSPIPFMQGPGVPNAFFNMPMQDPTPQDFGKIESWRRGVE